MEEKVIRKKGTKYELNDFRGGGKQFIQFNEKLENGEYVNGTTNEQVVNVLIKHLIHQNINNPDPITQEAIDFFKKGQDKLRERKSSTKQRVANKYGRKNNQCASYGAEETEGVLADNK